MLRNKHTSSLANLGNGLGDWAALVPSKNLLALELILRLIEGVETVSEDVEEAVGETDGGTETENGRETLDFLDSQYDGQETQFAPT